MSFLVICGNNFILLNINALNSILEKGNMVSQAFFKNVIYILFLNHQCKASEIYPQ